MSFDIFALHIKKFLVDFRFLRLRQVNLGTLTNLLLGKRLVRMKLSFILQDRTKSYFGKTCPVMKGVLLNNIGRRSSRYRLQSDMSFLFYFLSFASSDFELWEDPDEIKETINNTDVMDIIDIQIFEVSSKIDESFQNINIVLRKIVFKRILIFLELSEIRSHTF